jgi:hypothetical protein
MKGNNHDDDEYISDNFDQDGYDETSPANQAAAAIANQKHALVDKEVERVIKKNEDTKGYSLPMDDESDQGQDNMDDDGEQMEDEDEEDGDQDQ